MGLFKLPLKKGAKGGQDGANPKTAKKGGDKKSTKGKGQGKEDKKASLTGDKSGAKQNKMKQIVPMLMGFAGFVGFIIFMIIIFVVIKKVAFPGGDSFDDDFGGDYGGDFEGEDFYGGNNFQLNWEKNKW